jgi:D-sedoheptulose 7-phosphate isomerase
MIAHAVIREPADALAAEQRLAAAFHERNRIFEEFFSTEAARLAETSREMANRFRAGGRLLAFGRGCYATDAQHVSVEFVHPVIVGKRALPALDISAAFRPWLEALAQPEDIVMGFQPPGGDPEVEAALERVRALNPLIVDLPRNPRLHSFVHQELIEILYHTLWETVHVFLEHQGIGQDAGSSGFLYPFLEEQNTGGDLVQEVAGSIIAKVGEDAKLRSEAAQSQAGAFAETVAAMRAAIAAGGKLILFGNGGSATDANDWALDCIAPPAGYRAVPAISLAMEPANISALANDVGPDVIFLRQLIAHAKPNDVAVAISTSGGSRNIIAALEEARRRRLLTVALLGYDGGEVARRGLADHAIVIGSDYIPRIQEVQASFYHVIRDLLEPDRA